MKQKNTISLFLLFGSLSLLLSCRLLSLQNQEIAHGRDEYYVFNPETVLTDILESRESTFKPLYTTPTVPGSMMPSATGWTEINYYEVAQAAHRLLWGENPQDWNLRHATLSLNCANIPDGPQFGVLIFNKVVKLREQASLIEHTIYIDLSDNTVHLVETEFYPNLLNQYPTANIYGNYSIEDVVEIAERIGGKEIRKDLSNKCQIRIQLFGDNDNWRVTYVSVLDIFEVDVNIFTGQHRIIKK
jgi:hypothetical protein